MRHSGNKFSSPLEIVRVPVHAPAHDTATGATDGALSPPADNFDLSGERGPSPQDSRRRFNSLTNFRLSRRECGLVFEHTLPRA